MLLHHCWQLENIFCSSYLLWVHQIVSCSSLQIKVTSPGNILFFAAWIIIFSPLSPVLLNQLDLPFFSSFILQLYISESVSSNASQPLYPQRIHYGYFAVAPDSWLHPSSHAWLPFCPWQGIQCLIRERKINSAPRIAALWGVYWEPTEGATCFCFPVLICSGKKKRLSNLLSCSKAICNIELHN